MIQKSFTSCPVEFLEAAVLACMAGVERGRERGNLNARERERKFPFLSPLHAPHTLVHAQIPPSPFNAGHTGYSSIDCLVLSL